MVIDLWAALKGAQQTFGKVTVFLRDFIPEIGNATVFDDDWQGGSSTFVKKTILIPNVNHTIPQGHQLEARLIVDKKSDSDMWFAYDTISYQPVIKIP